MLDLCGNISSVQIYTVAFVTGNLCFGFIFNDLNEFVCYFYEMCNDVKV